MVKETFFPARLTTDEAPRQLGCVFNGQTMKENILHSHAVSLALNSASLLSKRLNLSYKLSSPCFPLLRPSTHGRAPTHPPTTNTAPGAGPTRPGRRTTPSSAPCAPSASPWPRSSAITWRGRTTSSSTRRSSPRTRPSLRGWRQTPEAPLRFGGCFGV